MGKSSGSASWGKSFHPNFLIIFVLNFGSWAFIHDLKKYLIWVISYCLCFFMGRRYPLLNTENEKMSLFSVVFLTLFGNKSTPVQVNAFVKNFFGASNSCHVLKRKLVLLKRNLVHLRSMATKSTNGLSVATSRKICLWRRSSHLVSVNWLNREFSGDHLVFMVER